MRVFLILFLLVPSGLCGVRLQSSTEQRELREICVGCVIKAVTYFHILKSPSQVSHFSDIKVSRNIKDNQLLKWMKILKIWLLTIRTTVRYDLAVLMSFAVTKCFLS